MQQDTSRFNGLLEIPHLHLDLHDQGPLGVALLGDKRPICWPKTDLTDDALDEGLTATVARSTNLLAIQGSSNCSGAVFCHGVSLMVETQFQE
jgi:hypothetical protein